MVAPRKTKKIFCTVIRVTENQEIENGHPSRFSTRPSRLLPWADPYIAKLVRNLQDEVREELRTGRNSDYDLKADLDPLPATDPEGGWYEETRWSPWDDTGYDSH